MVKISNPGEHQLKVRLLPLTSDSLSYQNVTVQPTNNLHNNTDTTTSYNLRICIALSIQKQKLSLINRINCNGPNMQP